MKILVAQRIAAATACFGIVVQPVMAGAPIAQAAPSALSAPSAPAVADVALGNGGMFIGKVVNAQGAPLANVAVSMHQAGQEVATTTTDAEGVFAVQGLRGGVYQVVSEGGVVSYRLWAPNTAPPAANQSALIVTGDAIVNGQYGSPGALKSGCIPRTLEWIQQHPIMTAGIIATAIAVPIAVSAADDDDPAS